MAAKTDNFDPKIDIKLCCTCGRPKCDKRGVKQFVLNMLQGARIEYGFPMNVTSGGRCPYHPDEAHRDDPADHQKQNGVDIKITGLVMAMKIMLIAVKYGFNAFGINLKVGFIHLGYRHELEGKTPAVWTY